MVRVSNVLPARKSRECVGDKYATCPAAVFVQYVLLLETRAYRIVPLSASFVHSGLV